MENNNKESFKLLGMSESGSDSGSAPEFVVTPGRKKKVKRRVRSSNGIRVRNPEPCACRGRTVGLSLAVTLLLCWLILLTWLAVVLHSELKRLDLNVHKVVAGSQSVPDALQKCHSLSRGLQQNQTVLFTELITVYSRLDNFSNQLMVMKNSLHEVQVKLKAAPELVNVPQNLKELKESVASFGSQIKDFDDTITELKSQNSKLNELSKILVTNITNIQQTVATLVNGSHQTHQEVNTEEKKAFLTLTSQLSQNISSVNNTLNSEIQWIKDDQKSDREKLSTQQELGQNISARVTTMEGDCVKASAEASLLQKIGNLTEQVVNSETQLRDLSSKFTQFQSNSSQLFGAVRNLQDTVSGLNTQDPTQAVSPGSP